MSVLDEKQYQNEAAAYRFVEARVWPDGPVCPHCGVGRDRVGKLRGESTRIGVYKCYACRKPFTVKVGTIFESSHIKLHIWLQAMFLMCSSKKGVSANQLHRTLNVSLKTAWFIGHRIREAMRDDGSAGPLGGEGKVIEADETFMGARDRENAVWPDWAHKGALADRVKVLTLLERGGRARSVKVGHVSSEFVRRHMEANASPASRLMTDEAKVYKRIGRKFAKHETVNHSQGEYARGDVTTNTVEGYFSVFKRGMRGTYQHCAEHHLPRYLAEFDFRYSNRKALGIEDEERTERAIRGIVGRRLTFR
jgi:transposase-like protein